MPPAQKPQITGDVQALPLGSQLVTALQGRPVSRTAPAKNQWLLWNGAQWQPSGPSGLRLASATRSSSVSTAGTTFAAGADVLSATLSLTADGTTSYVVRLLASDWANTAIASNSLRLNLDGSDAGFMAINQISAAGNSVACSGMIVITPSAGTHNLNPRLTTSAGTASINAGAGGASTRGPILVTIEIA